MKVDLKYGRNWGDAKHPWEELRQTTSTTISVEHQTSMVVDMPEEDKASIFGISVERELVSVTGEANRKGAAEDEFEEEGFEETVSTASVKPSTVTEIEAINIKLTSLGIAPLVPPTDTLFSKKKGPGRLKKDRPGKLRTPTAASRAIFSPACSALRPPRRFGFRRLRMLTRKVTKSESGMSPRASATLSRHSSASGTAERATYFAVSTVRPGATTWSKATLAELNGLHVDIDFKSIAITPEEAECKLQEVMHLPSKIVHSGGVPHLLAIQGSIASDD